MNIAANLPPYPTYSPSGLDWLPEIPAHWRTERGKWLFKKMKRPVRGTDEVVTCFRDGVVTLRKNRRTEGFTESLQEIGYQGIRAGDLVVHAMDAFAGAIGVSDSDGKGTPVYSVCQLASNANSHFYAHVLREMARSQWIVALATGIRERSTDFRYATLASQRLPLPPLPEQHAIARYLDHVDRRIQRYIDTKEKLIALLQEARQATIHRAVTLGLDLDMPLKPSFLEWLPEIPFHWRTERAKWLLKKMKRPVRDTDEVVTCFRDGAVTLRKNRRTEGFTESLQEIGYQGIRAGDLVIHAMDAFAGAIGVADSDGKGTPVYSVCRPEPNINAHYFAFILREMARSQWIAALATGIRERSTDFRYATMASQRLPLPPLTEQNAVVAHLDKATAAINAAIDTARRQADLMREYRVSLISHVVTGKLDVRAAAERIPMETPRP